MRARALSIALAIATVGGGFAACKDNTVNQSSSTTNNFTSIGPAGGFATGPDGTRVDVPGGALTAPVDMGILAAEKSEYPAMPATVAPIGNIYAFHPHGQFFLIDATITMPAPTGDVDIYRAEPGGSWALFAKPKGNGGFVKFRTSTFSFYAAAAGTGGCVRDLDCTGTQKCSPAGVCTSGGDSDGGIDSSPPDGDGSIDSTPGGDSGGDAARVCPRPPATGITGGAGTVMGTWAGKTLGAADTYLDGYGFMETDKDSGLPSYTAWNTIHFVDYANVCGHRKEDLRRPNKDRLIVSVGATAGSSADTKVPPGTYAMGKAAATDAGVRTVTISAGIVTTDAACKEMYNWATDVTGSITLTETTPRMKGTFNITSPYAVSGSFDSGYCSETSVDLCCLK